MVQADGNGADRNGIQRRQWHDNWLGQLEQDRADAQRSVGDPELLPVKLSQPLPCGMAGCHRPTTRALVEQDAESAGLWRLLPICPSCAEGISASAERDANEAQSAGIC